MFATSRRSQHLLCYATISIIGGCGIQGPCQPDIAPPPAAPPTTLPSLPPSNAPTVDWSLRIAPGEDGVMPDLSTLNIVALHKASSPQYDGQCLKCHADVLNQPTLNSQVLAAHQIMIPQMWEFGYDATVGVRNRDCKVCHNPVWITQENPPGDIRKQTPVVLCAECHGPPGSPPLYQVGGGS